MVADDEVPEKPGPFHVRTIRRLVALMSRHNLTEIDLSEGEVRIRLRRTLGREPAPTVAEAAPPVPNQTPAVRTPAPETPQPAKTLVPIKSPTPGIFYAASGPGAEPFVRVGSRVSPTSVVCIIEAMKIFNEIQAECSGVVSQVLVENQQAVEYGQVLFYVDPAG